MSVASLEGSKRVSRVVLGGLVALACAVFASSTMAALYKWTDASGRVVYSDQPPTDTSIKVERVGGASPPSDPNAVKEMAMKELELKKRQQDAAKNDAKAEAKRIEVAKRAEQCTRMQGQVKQLAAEQIAYVRYNEKGELVYVDDATRRKERAELEAFVRQNC